MSNSRQSGENTFNMTGAAAMALPHSPEAERSVLGSMLISAQCIPEIIVDLREDDFYMQTHRDIFRAVSDQYNGGNPVDIITVAGRMEQDGTLDKVGGIPYLADLATGVPTVENVMHYSRIVKGHSDLRKLIAIAGTITKQCYARQDDPSMVKEQARQMLFDMDASDGGKDLEHIETATVRSLQMLEERYKAKGKLSGVPSGFRSLDNMTAGFQKGNLILLAARPGVGKSALALNVATHAALKANLPVAVFSLEMSKEELVNRIVSCEAMIDSKKFKTGDFSDEDWDSYASTMTRISKAPLYLDDTANVTVSDIRAKCQKLKMQKGGLGMIVIDYLQLMQTTSRSDNRAQAIGEITRALKILAKDMGVPILLLSQLNRAAEDRDRPALSDLRESGSIEQDADIVMFIANDTKKKGADVTDQAIPDTYPVEIVLAKHRSGSLGSVKLAWTGKYTRFDELDYQQ